ncbi:MAG: ABC transporter substrate-binding protein, partial [Thermodesulfobacteriota bacterium]|nr:ABC transporter substrate-binding protein [Thermodesulfobacteriota bacterium]
GKIEFPSMSAEAILRLNPKVIIDMVANLDKKKNLDRAGILRQWQTLSRVDAVRNGRVYIFSQGYVVVPGPRFILTLEQMARVIHPDLR